MALVIEWGFTCKTIRRSRQKKITIDCPNNARICIKLFLSGARKRSSSAIPNAYYLWWWQWYCAEHTNTYSKIWKSETTERELTLDKTTWHSTKVSIKLINNMSNYFLLFNCVGHQHLFLGGLQKWVITINLRFSRYFHIKLVFKASDFLLMYLYGFDLGFVFYFFNLLNARRYT